MHELKGVSVENEIVFYTILYQDFYSAEKAIGGKNVILPGFLSNHIWITLIGFQVELQRSASDV